MTKNPFQKVPFYMVCFFLCKTGKNEKKVAKDSSICKKES
jgi:hypothetical protein